ncbi:MAG TPA: helix-turn-helix domain-containing protein [Verrucomicrobiae bacterium]|nr:helix-turn-helix domain-containing protein [Verrucomicrobiae bacterium]
MTITASRSIESVRVATAELTAAAERYEAALTKWLRRRTPASNPQPIDEIKKLVAHHYGLSVTVIDVRNRTPRVAWARQVAMALSCEFTNQSISEVGRQFHRDHGTVLHAIQTVSDRCETCAGDRSDVEHLRNKIKSAPAAI